MRLMKTKKLKINRDLSTPKGKKLEGSIIEIECDSNNVPVDLFWRARVADSVIDNCVEFHKEKLKSKKDK